MLPGRRKKPNLVTLDKEAGLFDVELQQKDVDVFICSLGRFEVGKRIDAGAEEACDADYNS